MAISFSHHSRHIALIATFVITGAFVATDDANAKTAKASAENQTAGASSADLGLETAAMMDALLTRAQMQRYFETVRTQSDIGARVELVKEMRALLGQRVWSPAAMQQAIGETTPAITCAAHGRTPTAACFPHDVALSLLYYGLARARLGLPAEAQRYRECAKRVLPEVDDLPIALRLPPSFDDGFSGAVHGGGEQLVLPFSQALERESGTFAEGIRAVTFDLVRGSKQTAAAAAGTPLAGLRITAANRLLKGPEAFAKLATEDLLHLLSRVDHLDWQNLGKKSSDTCPDPRVLFLPDGEYTIAFSDDRSPAQRFEVGPFDNSFLLEIYHAGAPDIAGTVPMVAFYRDARLCAGAACAAPIIE